MNIIKTRKEAVELCLKFENVFEDYPFSDKNWCVVRHNENKKVFAWIFEKDGFIWINVKCSPQLTQMWRSVYKSVKPAYHLNKEHWNSIILDETVPQEQIENMIKDSYNLTKPKKRNSKP